MPWHDVGRGGPQAIVTRARLRRNRSRSSGGSTSVSWPSEAETSRWNAFRHLAPLRRERDGNRPPVARHRGPGDQPAAFGPVGQPGERRPLDAKHAGQLRHAPRPGRQHAQQPGLGGRQPVTFGRPGEDGLGQRGQPDQPVRHRMLPGLGQRITRPFGIKMFVIFIIIDTNYRMETDHGVHRGRSRLPAVPAAGQDRHRRPGRAAGRGAGRVRVRRDLPVRRRPRARADQEVPQRQGGPGQGRAGGRRPGVHRPVDAARPAGLRDGRADRAVRHVRARRVHADHPGDLVELEPGRPALRCGRGRPAPHRPHAGSR